MHSALQPGTRAHLSCAVVPAHLSLSYECSLADTLPPRTHEDRRRTDRGGLPNDHVAFAHENAPSALWTFTRKMSWRLPWGHLRAQGCGTADGWLLVKRFLNLEGWGTLIFVNKSSIRFFKR